MKFTEADSFKDARGESAIETLNTKLRGALQHVSSDLTLGVEHWLSSCELAVVVRKLLARKALVSERMKPFVLWHWNQSTGEYHCELNASMAGRYILKSDMGYDEYLEIMQNPETVHIAGHENHFGQVHPRDLETVYWLPQSKQRQDRRSIGHSTRPREDSIVNLASDESQPIDTASPETTTGDSSTSPDAAQEAATRGRGTKRNLKPIATRRSKRSKN